MNTIYIIQCGVEYDYHEVMPEYWTDPKEAIKKADEWFAAQKHPEKWDGVSNYVIFEGTEYGVSDGYHYAEVLIINSANEKA